MRHINLIVACILCCCTSQHAFPEAATTLGSTDANRCFEESRFAISDSSLVYCDRAIHAGNLTRRDLAATYSNRGIIQANLGKYTKALEDHNRAIEITPSLAEAYINRGNVFYHTHDYSSALADYEMASALGATPAHTPLYNKGLTLIRLKRNEEARAALEAALALSPESQRIKRQLDALETF